MSDHRILAGISTTALGACLVVFGAVLASWWHLGVGVLLVVAAVFVLAAGIALLAPPSLEFARDD